jgi:hypothetical protein
MWRRAPATVTGQLAANKRSVKERFALIPKVVKSGGAKMRSENFIIGIALLILGRRVCVMRTSSSP